MELENSQLGFIKLFRSLKEWEWYSDSTTLHLFIHCIISANWKPKRWQGVQIERGQFITSLERLCDETGMTTQQVRTRLKRLQQTGEIDIKSTHLYTLITVCKFDSYQQVEVDEQQTTNKPTTNQQQTSNKPLTTTKEGKEGEERKELLKAIPKVGEQHLEMLSKEHNLDLNYLRTQLAVADEYYQERGNEITYAKFDAWLTRDPQSRKNPQNPNKVEPPYYKRFS